MKTTTTTRTKTMEEKRGGEGGEEKNSEDDDNDDAFARMMEEVEREIERAKKQTDFFCSSSSHVGSTENALSGDQRGEEEEEEEAEKENETKEKENKRERRNRARREAVEWRRKKIEEKTFDPRAAFRERVKKKQNKNDENIDENAWQSPSVVMRRRRAENISVSTRKKSWTELETEWKRFEEKWKESQDDDDDDNESGNEKQRRSALRFQDIPFPPSGAGFLTFLISDQGPFSDDENGRKKARRELAKRWHPDKFAQKFSRLLKDEDREDVMELVKEVYQSGTALMNTLSWDG